MIRNPRKHSNPEIQKAFEDLIKRFESWRSLTVKGNRKVPEELWEDTIQLSAFFPLYRLAQTLGIDYNTLKMRMLQKNCRALEPIKSEFVELYQPAVSTTENYQLAEIISADGSVLKLYSGAIEEIIKAFKRS